jgi:hypothetical protein
LSRLRSASVEPPRRTWLPFVHSVIAAVTVVWIAAVVAQPEMHAIPVSALSNGGPALALRIRGSSFELVHHDARVTIPPAPDGRPDYARLSATLAKVRARMPGPVDLVVVGDDDLEYGAVVATLDAIRDDFPEPRLGWAL